MAKPEPFALSPEQIQKLLFARAAREEGEDEERLERLRQREEDAETLRSVARLLDETDFAAGNDLTYQQTAHLLLHVRALASNPNLDARLLKRPGEPQALNRDLRDLLFGTASLSYRLRGFLTRRSAGGQTALQLLCAVFPEKWPIVTRAGLNALELAPLQIASARQTARERYGLPTPDDGAEAGWSVPDNDVVLRLLTDVVIYQAVHDVLEADDYVQVHRLLSQGLSLTRVPRRRRISVPPLVSPHSAPATPYGPVHSASRSGVPLSVRELPEADYSTSSESENDAGSNQGSAFPSAGVLPVAPDISHLSALDLLADIEREIAAQGFTYPPLTIRNYYISLQSKPFALLSGLSGTGKTRLTSLFADALTGRDSGQYRLLPVRPDWSDSAPLLGFVNLLAPTENGRGRFVSTPFLDFLLRASRPEAAHRAFFLCLDELNLARVEHYFAEILSAMETANREFLLPDGRALRLPSNLFLTGTLNLEEGTHILGRKVLDRANTLTFTDVCLQEESKEESAEIAQSSTSEPQHPVSPTLPLRQAFFLHTRAASVAAAREKLRGLGSGSGLESRLMDSLTGANALLEPHGLHFAYRVRDEILRYAANSFGPDGTGLLVPHAPNDAVLNLTTALDFQMLQKVLPRLGGTRETVEPALSDLVRWSEKRHLTQTTRKLKRMLSRAQRDGFVTFDEA